MAAAINDGRELHAGIAAAHIQSTYALRPVNLVPADGQQVNVVLLNVNGDFANGLYAIHSKENPAFLGNFADFRDGIDDTNFIVGVHDGDQNRRRLNGRFQLVQADAPVLLHRQVGDLEAMLLEVLAGIEHSFVLDGLSDDVVALLAEHLRDALDHQVVGLGRAAGKNNFFRSGVNQRSDLLARVFYRFLAGPAEGMVTAGRIAELSGEIRQHRLQHPWIDRGGRVIVHVNRQYDGHI